MKTLGYWKIRKKILNVIFKIKKVGFVVDSRRQSSKEYNSFTRLLIGRFISGAFKGIILALILVIIDRILSGFCETQVINRNILADIIIGELVVLF